MYPQIEELRAALHDRGLATVRIECVGSNPILVHLQREGTNTWWRSEYCDSDGTVLETAKHYSTVKDRLVTVKNGTYAVVVQLNAEVDDVVRSHWVPSKIQLIYVRPYFNVEKILVVIDGVRR